MIKSKTTANEKQNRLRFVLTLSCLAAVYGAVWAFRLLSFQSDSMTDILKMALLIFCGTLFFSYIWWTLVRLKWTGFKSGALAGGLTAICIIPLPTFLGALKSHFLTHHDLILSIKSAASYSLSTFSLAEFIAIPMSMAVGVWAAKS